MKSKLTLRLLEYSLPGQSEGDRSGQIEKALKELRDYAEKLNLSFGELYRMSAAQDEETFAEQWIDWSTNYNNGDQELSGEPYFKFEDYLMQDQPW